MHIDSASRLLSSDLCSKVIKLTQNGNIVSVCRSSYFVSEATQRISMIFHTEILHEPLPWEYHFSYYGSDIKLLYMNLKSNFIQLIKNGLSYMV